MHSPKVSVVMPVYNGEDYLQQAVESILQQTFTDFELIIVNDGSTDRTAALLEELAVDRRVRILHNDGNKGLTYTRNRGLAESIGAYIAMLDSDDVAHPKRLAKQVAFLDSNPALALVGSYIDLITAAGDFTRTQCYPTESDCIPSLLLFQNNFAQSSVMFRRSVLPAEVYREKYASAEDYDLWVRIANQYPVANLPERLISYRIHTNSVSQTKAAIQQECIRQIIAYQLQQLNINPTPEELQLHVQIGLLEIPTTPEALEKAANWLLKLKQANRELAYYPGQCFENIVALKWYEICRQVGANTKMFRPSVLSPGQMLYIIKSKLRCRFIPKV